MAALDGRHMKAVTADDVFAFEWIEAENESHHRHRLCDRRPWPRGMWLDSRADCFPNSRADCRGDSSADSQRDSSADSQRNARRDTDLNARTDHAHNHCDRV
jgi:hypothetical protein